MRPFTEPKIEISCPFCGANIKINFLPYVTYAVVNCNDEDQPYCDATFVVHFAVEDLTKHGQFGEIFKAVVRKIEDCRPAPRFFETTGGFWRSVYLDEIEAAQKDVKNNVFFTDAKPRYPELERVEFIAKVTDDVFLNIGTRAGLWYQFKKLLKVDAVIFDVFLPTGFTVGEHSDNRLMFERKKGEDTERVWFYEDKIICNFNEKIDEMTTRYVRHDFAVDDLESAVDWFLNPVPQPYKTESDDIPFDESELPLNQRPAARIFEQKSLVEQKMEAGETVNAIDFFTPPPTPEDFGGEDFPLGDFHAEHIHSCQKCKKIFNCRRLYCPFPYDWDCAEANLICNYKFDEVNQFLLETLATRTVGFTLGELLQILSLDNRFTVTEHSEKVLQLRLNLLVGLGEVTVTGNVYSLTAPPAASTIACPHCYLPSNFDKNDQNFPIIKCNYKDGCGKEFTYFQAEAKTKGGEDENGFEKL